VACCTVGCGVTGTAGGGVVAGGATSGDGGAMLTTVSGAARTATAGASAAAGLRVSGEASAEAPATPATPIPANAQEAMAARRNPERGESIAQRCQAFLGRLKELGAACLAKPQICIMQGMSGGQQS
jgi:hypothetical protein